MGSVGRRTSRAGIACAAVLVAAAAKAGPLDWGLPQRTAAVPSDAAATPANATADVRLVWVDLGGLVRGSYPEAVREVERLLARMGVRVSVREGDVKGTSDGSELTVVLLPGPPPGGPVQPAGRRSRAAESGHQSARLSSIFRRSARRQSP